MESAVEMMDIRKRGEDNVYLGQDQKSTRSTSSGDADTGLMGRAIVKAAGAIGGLTEAVASLTGFSKKDNDSLAGKAASDLSDQGLVVVQPTTRSHRGEEDPLAIASDQLNQLKQTNTKLTQRLSKLELEKKEEVLVLNRRIAELGNKVYSLEREVKEKDQIIAENKATIQGLSDQRGDACSELSKTLQKKEAKLADILRQLHIEKGRVRAAKTAKQEKQKLVDTLKQQLNGLKKKLITHYGEPFEDVNDFVVVDKPSDSQETKAEALQGSQELPSTAPISSGVEPSMDSEDLIHYDDDKDWEMVDSSKIHRLEAELELKNQQISNLECQLEETRAVAVQVEQVKDHSKTQSKALMQLKQELDATEMSHDELVQYIQSLKYQIEDTERHCHKLEKEKHQTTEDMMKALTRTQQDLKDCRERESKLVATKTALDTQLLEVTKLTSEHAAFVQELQDQLQIARAKAEGYKEDFLEERTDREKAHDLKEEMRLACEQRVHAITSELETVKQAHQEAIMQMTRKLEGVTNEKDQIRATRELRETRSSALQAENRKLQDQLFEVRQKAIAAQEEVQAKTAQVKQYKKKDDQREEKFGALAQRNEELVSEMEKVQNDLAKTKVEYQQYLEEEKKAKGKEMHKVRSELEKALKKIDQLTKNKKMTSSNIQLELQKLQEENDNLKEANGNLCESLKKVEEQFSRLMVKHRTLKSESNSASSLNSPSTNTQLQSQSRQLSTVSGSESQRNATSTSEANRNPQVTSEQTAPTATGPPGPVCPSPSEPCNQPPKLRVAGDSSAGDSSSQFTPSNVNVTQTSSALHSCPNQPNPNQSHSEYYAKKQATFSAPITAKHPVAQQADLETQPSHMELVLGDDQAQKQRPTTLPPNLGHQPGYPKPDHSGNGMRGWNDGYRSAPIEQLQWENPQGLHQEQQYQGGVLQPASQYHPPNQQFSPSQNLPPNQQLPAGQYMPTSQQLHVPPGQQFPTCQRLPPNQQMPSGQYLSPSQNLSSGQQVPLSPNQQNALLPLAQQYSSTPQYEQQQYPVHQTYASDQPVGLHPQQQQVHHGQHGDRYPQENDSAQFAGSQHPSEYYHSQALSGQQVSQDLVSSDGAQTPAAVTHFPGCDNVDIQARPKPKPRAQARAIPDTPSPMSDPILSGAPSRKPNDTRLLVQQDELLENIGEDISEAAAEVNQTTTEDNEREGAPLDPNLVCPMCMKQYRIGEIQLFRAHVNKCDGTKH